MACGVRNAWMFYIWKTLIKSTEVQSIEYSGHLTPETPSKFKPVQKVSKIATINSLQAADNEVAVCYCGPLNLQNVPVLLTCPFLAGGSSLLQSHLLQGSYACLAGTEPNKAEEYKGYLNSEWRSVEALPPVRSYHHQPCPGPHVALSVAPAPQQLASTAGCLQRAASMRHTGPPHAAIVCQACH
eukprot:917461-Pelagomonas_calceolata.AAC.13